MFNFNANFMSLSSAGLVSWKPVSNVYIVNIIIIPPFILGTWQGNLRHFSKQFYWKKDVCGLRTTVYKTTALAADQLDWTFFIIATGDRCLENQNCPTVRARYKDAAIRINLTKARKVT